MFAAILKSVTGFFGGLGIWGYVAVAAVAATGTAYVTHAIDASAYKSLQLADANAALKAEQAVAAQQKRTDKITLDAALAEAQAQQKIVTRTVTLTKEVPIHVSDNAHCITYGLVRVLDAAATPDRDVPFATGKSDDSCAPVSWRLFAAELIDDYGSGNANAEQLSRLQAWAKAQAGNGGGK